MSKGGKAAAYARKAAQEGKGYLDLSAKMCWDAVVLCAKNAGALSSKESKALQNISAENFSHFVSLGHSKVKSAGVMQAVPEGAFLGFIESKGGKDKLIHAMIATGKGMAAGNKNACIGIGNPVGWENLNVAGQLKWNNDDNGTITVGDRSIAVRYRPL